MTLWTKGGSLPDFLITMMTSPPVPHRVISKRWADSAAASQFSAKPAEWRGHLRPPPLADKTR